MEEKTYFRNRSRESIVDLVRVIRSLQRLNDFPDSQIFQTILNVCEMDGGSSFLKGWLTYMIEELREHERLKSKIKKHFRTD